MADIELDFKSLFNEAERLLSFNYQTHIFDFLNVKVHFDYLINVYMLYHKEIS